MELHKFISEALTQIIGGITDANNKLTDGEPIEKAPKPFLLKHGGGGKEVGTGVEFDLAVTSKSEKTGKGGIKATLLSVIDAEVGAGVSHTNENISRIKFTVFVNQWRG